jgi:exonuclease III
LAAAELASGAKSCAIYKDQKLSDHAPITITSDWNP